VRPKPSLGTEGVEALVPGVLDLLGPDDHRQVGPEAPCRRLAQGLEPVAQ
jgi:hypothetical protein